MIHYTTELKKVKAKSKSKSKSPHSTKPHSDFSEKPSFNRYKLKIQHDADKDADQNIVNKLVWENQKNQLAAQTTQQSFQSGDIDCCLESPGQKSIFEANSLRKDQRQKLQIQQFREIIRKLRSENYCLSEKNRELQKIIVTTKVYEVSNKIQRIQQERQFQSLRNKEEEISRLRQKLLLECEKKGELELNNRKVQNELKYKQKAIKDLNRIVDAQKQQLNRLKKLQQKSRFLESENVSKNNKISQLHAVIARLELNIKNQAKSKQKESKNTETRIIRCSSISERRASLPAAPQDNLNCLEKNCKSLQKQLNKAKETIKVDKKHAQLLICSTNDLIKLGLSKLNAKYQKFCRY